MVLDHLEPRQLLSASLIAGVLKLEGTNRGDDIRVELVSGEIRVTGLGKKATFKLLDVTSIEVYANNGHDKVTISQALDRPTAIHGGNGNDTCIGGGGTDNICGGNGKDELVGRGGDDTLRGGVADDVVDGGAGDDSLSGGDGDDHIVGRNGEDTLTAGEGTDTLSGGRGNDYLSYSFTYDRANGGPGKDELANTDKMVVPIRSSFSLFDL